MWVCHVFLSAFKLPLVSFYRKSKLVRLCEPPSHHNLDRYQKKLYRKGNHLVTLCAQKWFSSEHTPRLTIVLRIVIMITSSLAQYLLARIAELPWNSVFLLTTDCKRVCHTLTLPLLHFGAFFSSPLAHFKIHYQSSVCVCLSSYFFLFWSFFLFTV